MNKLYKVAIIGTGNVAWHLAPAIENAGHKVMTVYGRDARRGAQLMNRLYGAEWKPDLDFSDTKVDIILICVSDDAISEVSKEIILPDGAILAHTSGAKPMEELSFAAADAHGVFYPLQTFSKGKEIEVEEIPFLIEASSDWASQKLLNFAATISQTVRAMDSAQRRYLHLSAVFACNFSNFMMLRASQIMESQGLDFELLHPLIAETVNKTLEIGPKAAQTGPAIRKDVQTLEAHLDLLEDDMDKAKVYRALSQQIIDEWHRPSEEEEWEL
ncbi:Rossmann-like and DUF2520 domain-containing protein [Persicobacter diffluens]|uniref:DUF2520 domain-containing protein n=1 Tax=Persicobacter diffluens TaxID=981 RepID=A0AAN5AHY6_9BACT|nr:hypothetical protein PEDI_03820 [Persicobacter diffluens]